MIQRQRIFARQTLQALATLFMLVITVASVIECDRQTAGRRLANNAGASNGFKSNCGTQNQVSQKIGKCIVPMLDVIEGKIKIPKNDEDLMENCNRFNTTGNCIRQISKDCLAGLHKTSTSSIASATKRIRNAECKSVESRARYTVPLTCAAKLSQELQATLRNHTGIAQAIRDLPSVPAEQKMVKICCMMDSMDQVIEKVMRNDCPSSTPLLLNILHTLTEDARSTLCRQPKCENALKEVIPSQYKAGQNLLEPIVQILLMINVN